MIILLGCDRSVTEFAGNPTSDAAQLEAAQIALDDGEYIKVIQLLSDQYSPAMPDPEAGRLLTSAYLGLAGIDMTALIANSSATSGQESFDTFASAFSLHVVIENDRRYLHSNYYGTIHDHVMKSAGYINDLKNHRLATESDRFELGLISIFDFILRMGSDTATVADTHLPINEAAYGRIIDEVLLHDSSGVASTTALNAALDSQIDHLKTDLSNISDSITVLNNIATRAGEEPTEFEKDLREFMTQLVGGTTAAHINTLSGETITDYLILNFILGG